MDMYGQARQALGADAGVGKEGSGAQDEFDKLEGADLRSM
jgi:hypothetical protein